MELYNSNIRSPILRFPSALRIRFLLLLAICGRRDLVRGRSGAALSRSSDIPALNSRFRAVNVTTLEAKVIIISGTLTGRWSSIQGGWAMGIRKRGVGKAVRRRYERCVEQERFVGNIIGIE